MDLVSRRTAVLILALTCLVLASCATNDSAEPGNEPRGEVTTTRSEATPTSIDSDASTTTTSPLECAPDAPAFSEGTNAESGEAAGDEVALLTEVVVERVNCTDRIRFVFESTNGVPVTPAYTVEYRDGPFTEDPSDLPATIAGTRFIHIHFEGASGVDLSGPTFRETYLGPDSIVPTGAVRVAEVSEIGDFEAVMTWVIGIDENSEVPFDVVSTATSELTVIVG